MDGKLRAEIAKAIPEGGLFYADTDSPAPAREVGGVSWPPLLPMLAIGALLPVYWYAMMKKGLFSMDLSQKTVHRIFTLLVDALTKAEEELAKLRPEAAASKRFEEMNKTLSEEARKLGNDLEAAETARDNYRVQLVEHASRADRIALEIELLKRENAAVLKGRMTPTTKRLTKEIEVLRANNASLRGALGKDAPKTPPDP